MVQGKFFVFMLPRLTFLPDEPADGISRRWALDVDDLTFDGSHYRDSSDEWWTCNQQINIFFRWLEK